MQNIKTYLLPNGDVFKGIIVNNMRTGYGIYNWINGDVYKGLWSNNNING